MPIRPVHPSLNGKYEMTDNTSIRKERGQWNALPLLMGPKIITNTLKIVWYELLTLNITLPCD